MGAAQQLLVSEMKIKDKSRHNQRASERWKFVKGLLGGRWRSYQHLRCGCAIIQPVPSTPIVDLICNQQIWSGFAVPWFPTDGWPKEIGPAARRRGSGANVANTQSAAAQRPSGSHAVAETGPGLGIFNGKLNAVESFLWGDTFPEQLLCTCEMPAQSLDATLSVFLPSLVFLSQNQGGKL